jgi:hypothetical protein
MRIVSSLFTLGGIVVIIRILPWSCLCAVVLASGFMLAERSQSTAAAVGGREKSYQLSQVAEAARPTPPAKPEVTIASARSPVPLLITPHTEFFSAEPQQVATVTAANVAEPQQTPEKTETVVTSAKAMIEADGYKNVTALVKAPDGVWTGVALRGATQVAVSVDAAGNVSTQ